MKKLSIVVFSLLTLVLVCFLVYYYILPSNNNIEYSDNNNYENKEKKMDTTKNNNIVKTPENIKEPTFVNGVMIINKKNPLPKDYNPGENPEARAKINKLIEDMIKQNMNVSRNTSGFRNYEYQNKLYNNYVATHGKEQADKFSARAGYSEHQSGLAFDLIDNQGQLLGADGSLKSSIDAANWVNNNAHKYGFIVRYKKEFIKETGYNSESWHLRYVGEDLAEKLYKENKSLESFLNIEGGDYINK